MRGLKLPDRQRAGKDDTAYKKRTGPSDRSAKVRQYRRTGVTHFALNRKLSLDIHLTSPSTNEEGGDTREGEDRREDDDGSKLDQH